MDEGALRAQYEAAVARSGLIIPDDREQTMFNAFKKVVAWSDIVRTRRPGSSEPSNIYSLDTISRAGAAPPPSSRQSKGEPA